MPVRSGGWQVVPPVPAGFLIQFPCHDRRGEPIPALPLLLFQKIPLLPQDQKADCSGHVGPEAGTGEGPQMGAHLSGPAQAVPEIEHAFLDHLFKDGVPAAAPVPPVFLRADPEEPVERLREFGGEPSTLFQFGACRGEGRIKRVLRIVIAEG